MGRPIFNELPVEIIDEILLKLPVKSLLRFKCVSKSWRSSISSKGFITEHLNKSNSGTDFTLHNLICTYYQIRDRRDCIVIGSCCIGSLLNDDEPSPNCLRSNLSIPIPASKDNDINLLGSCNGLILIGINYRELYLWNPATRKAKNIILPPQGACSWEGCVHPPRYGYGFGYDESTRDYKVVCIFSCLKPYQPQMYMYSSRTESWKKIRNFDKGSLPTWKLAKFVNGRLYWLAHKDKNGASTSWHIVSLDLVEEKYQTHSFSDYEYPSFPALGDLGGYLSLTFYDNATCSVDVWVMIKYGEKESWSKIWTFFYQIGSLPKPLWLKKNGDIVVASNSDMVVYREKDKLRQSPVDMFNGRIESIVYVESLVSPFGNDEQLIP